MRGLTQSICMQSSPRAGCGTDFISTAGELGPHRITVNAYAPGIVDTPLCNHLISALPPVLMTYPARGRHK